MSSPSSSPFHSPSSPTKIILGIDPGSLFTGFGALKVNGDRVELLTLGVIEPPAKFDFNQRVGIISREIDTLMERLQPDATVVERIFMGKNADSAFKLGHVRGAIIASAVRAGSEIVEYATRSVKKGVTGNGGSTKEQVQLILFAALGIRGKARADASDALALAYYHSRHLEIDLSSARSQMKNERIARAQAKTETDEGIDL